MHPHEQPKRAGRAFIFPRWSLGTLEVRRSLNTESSSAVVLHISDAQLNDPEFIKSDDARVAIFLTLPFEHKLARLNWCLQQEDKDSAKENERTLQALVRALLIDLSEEQSALRRSQGPLDEEFLEQKLSNFGRLLKHPTHTQFAVSSYKWTHLIELCAGLQSMASAHFRWWRWWGRHKYLSKHLLAKLRPFTDELFNAYVIDTNQDVAMESGTAQVRINARVALLNQDFRDRYSKERHEKERKVSYDIAIHLHFERPEGMKYPITRDIDAWKKPGDLLWTEAALKQAQEKEEWREAKQEQLRKINEKIRADMLVAEQTKPQTVAVPDAVTVGVPS